MRVKIRRPAARELRNSREVQDFLLARAERMSAAAGPGFVADVQPGRARAHAMVKTTDFESRRAQARTNVLLKSVDAGR